MLLTRLLIFLTGYVKSQLSNGGSIIGVRVFGGHFEVGNFEDLFFMCEKIDFHKN